MTQYRAAQTITLFSSQTPALGSYQNLFGREEAGFGISERLLYYPQH